jgi:hypothetical protein
MEKQVVWGGGGEGGKCWDDEAEAVLLGGISWWVERASMFISSHCSLLIPTN